MGLLNKIKESWKNSSWMPRTKKDLLVISLTTLLGLSGALALDEHLKTKKAEKHQALYGLLSNPNYTIQSRENLVSKTLEEGLALANPEYAAFPEISKKLDGIEKNLARYEADIPIAKEEASKIRQECLESSTSQAIDDYLKGKTKSTRLDTLKRDIGSDLNLLYLLPMDLGSAEIQNFSKLNKLTDLLKERVLQNKKINEKEAKYGNFENYSKKLFEELTGKKTPQDLTYKIGNIRKENILAYHDFLSNKIKLEDHGYETSLLSKIHELGHACYQGNESDYFSIGRIPKESIFLEEAAAYLFEIAGTQMVKKENLELGANMEMLLAISRENGIREHSKGLNEEHAQGWAFADSLLGYFNGDAKAAFNHISTRNRLDQFNAQIVDKFNSYKNGIAYDGSDIPAKKEGLINRASQLQKRLEALEKKYFQEN